MSDQQKNRSFCRLFAAVFAILCGAISAVAPTAQATGSITWLTKVLREAGDAGQMAGGVGARATVPLARALVQLKRFRPEAGRLLVAATVSSEGHWTFVNRSGQRFTAANTDEMGRVARMLGDGLGTGSAGLDVIVADSLLFSMRSAFAALPETVRLWIVARGESFRVRGAFRDAAAGLAIDVRPDVQLRLSTQAALDEGLWQLSRSLRGAGLRIVALDANGPDTLPTLARIDPKTKALQTDRVDPLKLARSLPALRGQTVVIAGRIEDGALAFRAASGGEGHVALKDLIAAAERSDVNLIVLDARAPRQPGDRNWLWQTVTIDGLDAALGSGTKAEFLGALSGESTFVVDVTSVGGRRSVLAGRAIGERYGVPGGRQLSELMAELISEVAGTVVTNGIRMDLVGAERQSELDARLVPGIPSGLQFYFVGALVMGLLAFPVAWGWWSRWWPPERAGEYADNAGFGAAQVVRVILFGVLFLPLVGPVALVWLVVTVVFGWLMLPFRWLRRRSGEGQATG